jgi:hypothetical protein
MNWLTDKAFDSRFSTTQVLAPDSEPWSPLQGIRPSHYIPERPAWGTASAKSTRMKEKLMKS